MRLQYWFCMPTGEDGVNAEMASRLRRPTRLLAEKERSRLGDTKYEPAIKVTFEYDSGYDLFMRIINGDVTEVENQLWLTQDKRRS